MRSTCRRCGADLAGVRIFVGECEDLMTCLTNIDTMLEPPVVWVDLADLPPSDIDICSTCKGAGSVHTSVFPDAETGARPVAVCPTCEGSKRQPVTA